MKKKAFVGLVGTIAVLLIAGGLMASNMGFKLNYVLDGPGANDSQNGNNTIALPFYQQTDIQDAFDLGDDIGGFATVVEAISRFVPATDGFDSYAGSGPAFSLQPGEAYFAQLKPDQTGLSINYTIVGSHDPGRTIQFDGAGNNGSLNGNNFYAYPYHSTASNADELIIELGGLTVVESVSAFNRVSDGFDSYAGSGPAFDLRPGSGYFVLLTPETTSIQFVPSHY